MMPSFPPCRHRREPRMRQLYHCRSEKLIGLKLVSPQVCQACPYVDHHFPGEGGPFPDVHPGMSPDQLAELIQEPARAWPPGWEDWDVTHQAHHLAARQFLRELPPYPEGRFSGRGIVIAGGGSAYFPSLYVTVRAIRHVGCNLPIQAWFFGREKEMPPPHQTILERFAVECVDADLVRERYPCRILNGWELKAFAVLHSPFEEVLSLDADCYPVRDPEFLFHDAGYNQTGAVFWPDLRDGPPLDWRPFGLTPPKLVSIESGQFLVNKRLCWQPLQLAWWYNDHSDWFYLHGYGDKHTFEVAWAQCGRSCTMFREDVEWSLHSFKHVGPDGGLLFVHRCKDKFRFGEPDYMNPQAFVENHFHSQLPLEPECFAWMRELKKELGMTPKADGQPSRQGEATTVGKDGDALIQRITELATDQVFWYHRVGFDRRLMHLLPGGQIGQGFASREARWEATREGRLNLYGQDGRLTASLREESDGVFHGRWEDYERMPVEMSLADPAVSRDFGIEIGCGEHPHDGYHVYADILPFGPVNCVCPMDRIPYPDGTFTRLLAVDVLEHQSHALIPQTLREWHRVLASGGKATVQCPNGTKIIRLWMDGSLTTEQFNFWLLGGQGVERPEHFGCDERGVPKWIWNAHHAILTPQWLEELMTSAGFVRLHIEPDAGTNMIAEGYKP